ncbi:MAG: hypothetical protein HOV83_17745, partial [Catenulispora sp.]|nr:hypothetical protein [Catenulispora sp.]
MQPGGAVDLAADAARTAELVRLLDESAARARAAERPDLADKLADSKRRLASGAWHVLVAGEFKRGKSTLVNALLGVPVCGSDPVAHSAVPTVVRYGARAEAWLRTDSGAQTGAQTGSQAGSQDSSDASVGIDVRAAADYGLRGTDDDGKPLRTVEVALPRELLRDGLVLLDTPGIGGGFAAAAAAAAMRALSLADGVIVVTDASQELTASEVEFLRHAASVCPNLLCVMTKIDLYPQWRRILDLDRAHLRAAGIEAEIVAVSAPLRELAIDTGDPALLAESGFPVLVERIGARLMARRTERARQQAVAAVQGALRQLSDVLSSEHAALTHPDQRTETLRRVEDRRRRAAALSGAGASRWLNTINDRFADIQARVEVDLGDVCRRLEGEAAKRIKESDPARDWPELTPWLQRRTNQELTAVHTRLLALIDAAAGEISAVFDADAAQVGAVTATVGGPAGGLTLNRLEGRGAGKLEVGMQAARGWSLSSSVVTTLLVTTLHPGFLIALPITAVLGTAFAAKAVSGYKSSRLDAARGEASRAVAAYLGQSRADAGRAAMDLFRHSRGRVRDYFLD